MAVIATTDATMPVITGALRPLCQKTARIRPPSNAPLVRPRNEKAALRTNATCRLKYATKINATAQATVESLLKRK